MREKSTIPRADLLAVLKSHTQVEAARILGCSLGRIRTNVKHWRLDQFMVAHGDKLPISDWQHDIIMGNMLGDGSIHPKGYFRFKQKNHLYANHVFACLSPWMSGPYLTEGLRAFHSYVSPYFKEQRNRWYPHKKKLVPVDLELNARVMAYWHMDDGTNIAYNKQVVLYTNGFTTEDVNFLSDKIRSLGFRCSVNYMPSKHEMLPIIRISRRSYFDFLDFVRPHMFASMSYKSDAAAAPILKEGYGSYKLDKQLAEEIRNKYATGNCTQFKLASEHGVNRLAIFNIIHGKTYK